MSENSPAPAPPPYSEDDNEEPQDQKQPWADDALGRDKFAAKLTKVMQSFRGSSRVLAITVPYGGGKTFFAKRWQQELENAGEQVLFFDAWKSDFVTDPRTAIISQLLHKLEQLSDPNGKKLLTKKILCGMKNAVKGILIHGSPIVASWFGVPFFSECIKKISVFCDIVRSFKTGVHNIDKKREKMFEEESRKSLQAMDQFCTHLKEAVEATSEKQLFIFVDELDRCRPDHAVTLLECIKHLFRVEGVVFILFLSEDALAQAIRGVYGKDIDAEAYLRRFFNIRLSFPSSDFAFFVQALANRFQMNEVNSASNIKKLCDGFYGAAKIWDLKLRDQERAMCHLDFSLRAVPVFPKNTIYELIGFLGALREAKRELYTGLLAHDIKAYLEVFHCILDSKPDDKSHQDYQERYEVWEIWRNISLLLLSIIPKNSRETLWKNQEFRELCTEIIKTRAPEESIGHFGELEMYLKLRFEEKLLHKDVDKFLEYYRQNLEEL